MMVCVIDLYPAGAGSISAVGFSGVTKGFWSKLLPCGRKNSHAAHGLVQALELGNEQCPKVSYFNS